MVTAIPSIRVISAPPGPRGAENLRLLRAIFRDPVPVLEELRARYGPVCRLGAGPARLAVVGGPQAVHELLAMPTDRFRWGHKFNVLGFVVGDESLLVSDGDEHRRRRGSVQQAFSRRRLNGWIPMIVERTDAAVDDLGLRPGGTPCVVDLAPWGRRLVLEVVVRALFGDGMQARIDELARLFERPQAYLESPAVRQVPHRLPWTRRARVRADRRALDAIVDLEIARLRAHPTGDPLDVLAVLVAGVELTDDEIRDQVVTLIGAGYDTTAATLAWMLWCVSLAPGLWVRLRDEADRALGPPGEPAQADATTLGGLRLADAVVRETTRLHPAGVIAPREATVDVEVGGHRIAAGTLVVWSPYLVGRDPAAWPEPNRFDPDRFLGSPSVGVTEEQQALADLAWVPFGGGRRNCLGFALARMELTLVVARLAQRLDVAATAPEVPHPYGMVVNRPEGGAPMRVAARARCGSTRSG
jgi:cytochrome P450